MNISYRILGYAYVRVSDSDAMRLFNLCMREGIPYGQSRVCRDGVRLLVRLSRLSVMRRLCEREGIELHIEQVSGLPIYLYGKRKRYGIMLGILIAIALTLLSRQFIWRVDVVGNTQHTSAQITEMLEEYGIHVGGFIPRLDTDRIENDILMRNDGISWISVNLSGNIVTVELRELARGDTDDKDKPANLIATKDGRIEYVNIISGNVVVRSGDLIQKGQLLVSGIFDSNVTGMRFTRAEGKVYARTSEEIYIRVPYEYEGKIYTGEQYYDKYLNFFDFQIKISKNSRNEEGFYDKISIVENLGFPDGESSPLTLTTDNFLKYEIRTLTRTAEEAQELAYFELSQRLGRMSEDAVLLRKVIIPEIHEDFFALRCVIVCIEDIAEVVEFEADLSPVQQDK